jgi:hypothetical protein
MLFSAPILVPSRILVVSCTGDEIALREPSGPSLEPALMTNDLPIRFLGSRDIPFEMHRVTCSVLGPVQGCGQPQATGDDPPSARGPRGRGPGRGKEPPMDANGRQWEDTQVLCDSFSLSGSINSPCIGAVAYGSCTNVV